MVFLQQSLLKMLNYFLKIFYIFVYYKILVFFYKKLLKYEEFQFENILFTDLIILKKIFLSNNYLEITSQKEMNYNFHTFEWLNIAKKLGGANNIKHAKKHFFTWANKKYGQNSFIWTKFFISKRFINILYNYDFFSILSNTKEKILINKILYKHFLILNFNIKNKDINNLSIEDLKAHLIGSLLFKKKNDYTVSKINELLKYQIDKNGFHKSYNAVTQAEFINHLYELKNIFLFFKINLPPIIDFKLLSMTSLLLSLFHRDGSICLFNGSNNAHLNKVYEILKTSKDLIPKNINKLRSGIIIFNDKNKKLFMDLTLSTTKTINDNLHAGTLSFEYSCQNEKIITNCGSMDKKIGKNPVYLRYSAAHSTVILNNTNISELLYKKKYTRTPNNITFEEKNHLDSIEWHASHDGYLKNFKKIIKRKLIISKKIDEISGEDSIISTKISSKKLIYHIRFHLMPECNCILTNNKKNVLIKTKNNQSLIFKSNSKLSIEDSIIINIENKIKHTKQIVISGYTDDRKKIERWSIGHS